MKRLCHEEPTEHPPLVKRQCLEEERIQYGPTPGTIPIEISAWNQIESSKQEHLRMLVKEKYEYENAIAHIRHFPESVSCIPMWEYTCLHDGFTQDTILHGLCRPRVLDETVLELATLIVAIEPNFVTALNSSNETPLERAFDIKSVNGEKLVLEMIRANVNASGNAVDIWFPRRDDERFYNLFHLACEKNCSYEILHFMLLVKPSLARTPRNDLRYSRCVQVSNSPIDQLFMWDNRLTIKKVYMILKAGVLNEIPEETTSTSEAILHYACQYAMEKRIFNIVLRNFSTQTMETDSHGNLPLHYALYGHVVACKDEQHGRKYSNFVTQCLLKKSPEAARVRDSNGKLPLEIALDRGSSNDVIMTIAKAHPEALNLMGSQGLFPFAVAASTATRMRFDYTSNDMGRLGRLNVTYELLRMCPHVLWCQNLSKN